MKAIMISIKPKWVAKILNGEKTIEIRKTCPEIFKNLKPYEGCSIDVYIYCTKEDDFGRIKDLPKDRYFVDCVETPQDFKKMDSAYNGKGKVVAKFTLNKVEEIKPNCFALSGLSNAKYFIYRGEHSVNENVLTKLSCLSSTELDNYLKGDTGYAWHIDNLVIFDKPKWLCEFDCVGKKKNCRTCKEHCRHYLSTNTLSGKPNSGCTQYKRLTKAPQSYMFIEID